MMTLVRLQVAKLTKRVFIGIREEVKCFATISAKTILLYKYLGNRTKRMYVFVIKIFFLLDRLHFHERFILLRTL